MLARKHEGMRCAISSPPRKPAKKARGPACGGAACVDGCGGRGHSLLDQRNRLHLLGDDYLGQLRVRQALRCTSAVGQHPLQKILDAHRAWLRPEFARESAAR